MSTPAPLLEARALSRTFDVGTGGLGLRRRTLRAVEDVSFALAPGKVTALVGQSGSGKSTIARMLLRLHTPTSGSILLGEEDVAGSVAGGTSVATGPRSRWSSRTRSRRSTRSTRVGHHLERPLRVHKVVPSSRVDERVHELLDRWGSRRRR